MLRVPTDITSTLSDIDDATNQMPDQSSMMILQDDNTDEQVPELTDYQQDILDEVMHKPQPLKAFLRLFRNVPSYLLEPLIIAVLLSALLTLLSIILLIRLKCRSNSEAFDKAPLFKHEQSMNVDVERVVMHV